MVSGAGQALFPDELVVSIGLVCTYSGGVAAALLAYLEGFKDLEGLWNCLGGDVGF